MPPALSPSPVANEKPDMSKLLSLAFAVAAMCHPAEASAVDLTNPRCEYLVNPQGIDLPRPRLGWMMEDLKSASGNPQSATRGRKQTAYQVLVASSEELLKNDKGEWWDSGKVASEQSVLAEDNGKPPGSWKQCHWKVRVWDKDGRTSDWSQPAAWTMGLLKPEDWQAKWIGAGTNRLL